MLDLDRLVNGFERFRPNVEIDGAMISVEVEGGFYGFDNGVYPNGMRVLMVVGSPDASNDLGGIETVSA